MITRSNVRLGLTGAIIMIIVGSFTGCSDVSPTDVETSLEQREETCIFIDGTIMCKRG